MFANGTMMLFATAIAEMGVQRKKRKVSILTASPVNLRGAKITAALLLGRLVHLLSLKWSTSLYGGFLLYFALGAHCNDMDTKMQGDAIPKLKVGAPKSLQSHNYSVVIAWSSPLGVCTKFYFILGTRNSIPFHL